MKKVLNIAIFFIISFFLITTTTKAADSCTYKEQQALNKEASNIKFSYEVVYQNLPDGYKSYANGILDSNGVDVTDQFSDYYLGYYIKVYLSNISENMEVEINNADLYNSENELTNKVEYSSTDNGTIELKLYDTDKIKNIQFNIFATTLNCNNKKVFTKTLKTPRYNELSNLTICDEIKDYKYCQTFINTNASTETLIKKINEYKESLNANNKDTNNTNTILKKIIIISVSILVLFAIIYILIKYIFKRRKLK